MPLKSKLSSVFDAQGVHGWCVGGLWSLLADLRGLIIFREFLRDAGENALSQAASGLFSASDPLPDELKEQIKTKLEEWHRAFSNAEFPATAATCDHALREIDTITIGSWRQRGKELRENFEYDSRDRCAWTFSRKAGEMYGTGFSDAIDAAFPSAKTEIHEGRRCYALNRHTACVFHMMRAAEHALRVTVKAVGVSSTAVPLEYQQWQNLIEQLESRIKPIDNWRQPSKANAQAFFSRIIADFYSFKDDIRNVTMHTRTGGTYDEPGALSVMNRVQECFERLATRIDENKSGNLLDPSLFA